MNQQKERNSQEEAQALSLSQAHQELLLTDHCGFPHQSSQQTQDASTLRFFFPTFSQYAQLSYFILGVLHFQGRIFFSIIIFGPIELKLYIRSHTFSRVIEPRSRSKI